MNIHDLVLLENQNDLEQLQWFVSFLREKWDGLDNQRYDAVETNKEIRLLSGKEIEHLQVEIEGLRPDIKIHPLSMLQTRLRRLYKMLAFLEMSEAWHSPVCNLSLPIDDLSALSRIPGYNDYERGFVTGALSYEHNFSSYYPKAGITKSLLFSCGMGAIQTVLQQLVTPGMTLVVGKGIYHETKYLLSSMKGVINLVPIDDSITNPEHFSSWLTDADLLYLDSVTLNKDANCLDLNLLYQAIHQANRELKVVIDNTVMGPLFSVPPPPQGISLFMIESLIKYYQLGLDLGSAGILSLINCPDRQLWHRLETLRGTNGTNINPYNARLLPEVPRQFLLRRLARHRRNAFLLVDQLRDLCDVSCVGYGGLVFIKSGSPEELKDLITYLALSRKLSITEGTSFGFNMTRVCIADQEDGAYLRIACGTENIHHFSEIANLIRDALKAVESRKIQSSLKDIRCFFPDYSLCKKASSGDLSRLYRYVRALDQQVSHMEGNRQG